MKRGIFVAMIVCLIAGWFATIENLIGVPSDFKRLVSEAQKYEEEQLYIRAIDSYGEALTYNPKSLDVQIAIARDYLAVGDETAFTRRCESINESNNYPISVVTELADFYIEKNRDESAIKLLQKAMKRHTNNEELTSRYEKVRYTYKNLYISADEIGQAINGSVVFVMEGRYGIMNSKGKIRVRNSNEWCGAYSSDERLAPILKDGEFYFADTNGYRYEIPSEEDHIEALGILNNQVAPAKINGKYGYVSDTFEHLSDFVWDDATEINDGLGSVKQGDKWALINEKYEVIGDYVYQDVKRDENNFFCTNSRAFVNSGSGYQMINEKGKVVSEDIFEDAIPFVTNQPTAVKKDGKWGFVDTDGKIVIEPEYEEAGAFSNNLAPVKTTQGWGYINRENVLVIPDEFMGAKSFYSGIAPVKNGNQWTMIELNVKK